MKKIKVILILATMLISTVLCGTMLACGETEAPSSNEKITITYYLQPDSAPLTAKAKKYEEFTFSLHSLKRKYYTFEGMYEEPNGNGSMIIDKTGRSTCVFTDNITVYVYWLPINYTIELDAGDGYIKDSEKTKQIKYGDNIGLLPCPSLEGMEFDGWFCGETRISTQSIVEADKILLVDSNYEFPETGNIVLTAKFKIKQYTVNFDYNDGRVSNNIIKVDHGQEIPEELFPQEDTGSKILYAWSISTNTIEEFKGVVTEDITLYAFWKKYKTFKFYDGVQEQPTEEKIFQNEPLELERLENRNGYTFKGWYSNELGIGDPIINATYGSSFEEFYAIWNINTYNLNLEANGGTCEDNSLSYTIETETFDLPSPNKKNYSFIGWCENIDLSGKIITKIEKGTFNITNLYAKYKGEDKTLILDAGDGFVENDKKVVEFGTSYKMPIPILDEYVFIGWFEGEYSSSKQLTDENGNSLELLTIEDLETTIYAHYKEKLYIDIENKKPKAGSATVKEYYLEGETVVLNATLNAGYKFIGWYENGELISNNQTYEFTMGASWLNLEIVYEANKFIIKLVPGENASCEETEVIVEFGEYYKLPVPEKPAYSFIGWKLNSKIITNENGESINEWDKTSNVTVNAYFVEEDPNNIYVHNAQTFMSIAQDPSASYSVVSEVDMAGIMWTPFDFSGTIKGNGLVIKNLTVISSSGHLGVFTKFSGKIYDLVFENLTIVSTSYNPVYVGGICAEMTGGTLEQVIVKGSVTGDNCKIGGFVGNMTNGTITDCVNYANVKTETIETSNLSAGGIVGTFTGGAISTSQNYGNVTAAYNVGGIIGYANNSNFTELTNNGVVTGKNYVAGIVGLYEKSGNYTMASPLTNNGNINGIDYVGGIIGRYNNNASYGYNDSVWQSKISKFTNAGDIIGNNYVGGCVGYVYGEINGSYSDGYVIITLSNFTNIGDVTGKSHVGGILGRGQTDRIDSMLTSSSSSGKITSESYLGGIAGSMNNFKMVSCDNTGTEIVANGYILDGSSYYVYVGGYVGYGSYIENCHNAVDIKHEERGDFVGGVAGVVDREIVNCSNTASVDAKKSSYVGGLVGRLTYASGFQIVNISNTGVINGANYTGGLFGQIIANCNWGYNNSTYSIKINKATNSGDVNGATYVGGVLGEIFAQVVGSYSDGSIIVTMIGFKNTGNIKGTKYVGGLIGKGYTDNGASELSNSSSSADIVAEAYVGGLAGRLENIKMLDCSNENSFITATSYSLEGSTYYAYVGGYVGYGYYVENCDNAVEINYDKNALFVGGIAGRLNNRIKESSNTATVNAPNATYVGGLVGEICNTSGYEITGLNNSATIIGTDYVGGVIGRINDDCNWGYNNSVYIVNINKITNSGNIIGRDYVGGIIGDIYAIIHGSYSDGSINITANLLTNTGNVTGKTYIGGLIGKAYADNNNSQIVSSSSSSTITAEAIVGCLAGRLENIKIISSSNANSTLVATGYILEGTIYQGYIGGYVGYGYYIQECNNAVEINYTAGGNYVGGIAGKTNWSVANCTNTANVTTNSCYVGGIVGELAGLGAYELSNLTNSGNISGKTDVGGIFGKLNDRCSWSYNNSTYNVIVKFVKNTGNISGTSNVAGCIGTVDLIVNGSYSDGSVIMTATEIETSGEIIGTGNNVAGIFGYIYTDNGNSSIANFKFTGTVNGNGNNIIGHMENFIIK